MSAWRITDSEPTSAQPAQHNSYPESASCPAAVLDPVCGMLAAYCAEITFYLVFETGVGAGNRTHVPPLPASVDAVRCFIRGAVCLSRHWGTAAARMWCCCQRPSADVCLQVPYAWRWLPQLRRIRVPPSQPTACRSPPGSRTHPWRLLMAGR